MYVCIYFIFIFLNKIYVYSLFASAIYATPITSTTSLTYCTKWITSTERFFLKMELKKILFKIDGALVNQINLSLISQ